MDEAREVPVSVVIPTHARPDLMRRAVRTVLEQQHAGPIEVIVVFDRCDPVLPDVTVPATRTLRGLVNSRTPGLAGARNTGVLAATHELIAFLDDDDCWLPSKLACQLPLFAAHPESVLVGSAMVVDEGTRTHERLLPGGRITHTDLLHNRLAPLHSSTIVVRRGALLGQLGLVDEDLPHSYGEDYDLLLRAAAIAPIPVVNRPLVRVAWQGGSHFVGRWAAYAEALQHLAAKHPEFASHRKALARIEAQTAFALAASGQRAVGGRIALRAIRRDPVQPKGWLAMAVAARLVSGDRVERVARRFGRGI